MSGLRIGSAVLVLVIVGAIATIDWPKTGAALAFAGVTGAIWVQSSIVCKPDDPSIYLGGVLMAGCPNDERHTR